jgi:hypothetical protein
VPSSQIVEPLDVIEHVGLGFITGVDLLADFRTV